jgi:hypothetical protein
MYWKKCVWQWSPPINRVLAYPLPVEPEDEKSFPSGITIIRIEIRSRNLRKMKQGCWLDCDTTRLTKFGMTRYYKHVRFIPTSLSLSFTNRQTATRLHTRRFEVRMSVWNPSIMQFNFSGLPEKRRFKHVQNCNLICFMWTRKLVSQPMYTEMEAMRTLWLKGEEITDERKLQDDLPARWELHTF